MQRLPLSYLAFYLLIGGLGLLLVPRFVLRLLLSNGDYGDVMPRMLGLFMAVLGGVIFQFVRRRDYRYFVYTIGARSCIVVVQTLLYLTTRDPLFVVLDTIVLIGLLPSIYIAVRSTGDER